MTAAQIAIPRAEIADFCRRNGIRQLALFGSVLTNRFSEASDIDILVQFRPQERVGFFRLADMEAQMSGLLGGRKVDLRPPMISAATFATKSSGTRWFSMTKSDAIRLRH